MRSVRKGFTRKKSSPGERVPASASGVVLEADVLARIESVFSGLAETDPRKTQMPAGRGA